MRPISWGLAAAGVAAAAGFLLTLPTPPLVREVPGAGHRPDVLTGALHVHTIRSDGTGTVDEVAAAAARAGLDFVILTDHGTATRAPLPPTYRAGVLCLDGVEISTAGGHYLAIGLPQAPYPLAGDPDDVVADVQRLGGFGIVAHPGSVKPELQWRRWGAPVDGIEWLNADSEWRDESPGRLLLALFHYPLRPVATLGSLLDRPADVLARWDRLLAEREVVGLAGADAHARIGLRSDPYESGEEGLRLRVPSYEASFRSFALRVGPVDPPTGDPEADAAALLEGLRKGRVYTGIDALAPAGGFRFTATRVDGSRVEMGERVELLPGTQPLRLTAAVAGPPDTTIVLIRDGAGVRSVRADELEFQAPPEAAVYRVEVRLPEPYDGVPWIVSNPIYFRLPARAGDEPEIEPPAERLSLLGPDAAGWSTETGGNSGVSLLAGEDRLRLQFRLGGEAAAEPYAALQSPAPPRLSEFDRLVLSGSADRPLRASVQLRAGDRRWRRSIYLDRQGRTHRLPLGGFRATDPGQDARVPLDAVESILIVVDLVNASPGATGTLEISEIRLER